jgi:phosphate transport system permease protein
MTILDERAPEPESPEQASTLTATRTHDQAPLDVAFRAVLRGCLAVGVVFLVVLLAVVIIKGWPRLDLALLTNQMSQSKPETSGGRAAILGTIWIMVMVAIASVPIGVMAAIYLEEYADRSRWYNRFIELNIQNLAAIPSVVYGIVGLAFIARGPLSLGPVLWTGAATLTLLILPVIIITAREAIRAVPQSMRDGSLALGATQWQTVRRTVLPNAVPGIATGSILGLSRAIGEAAPLIIIGVAAFVTFDPSGPNSRFTTLPIQIYNSASRPQEDFIVLSSALIVVLLVILLAMNSVAIFIRNKYQRRW